MITRIHSRSERKVRSHTNDEIACKPKDQNENQRRGVGEVESEIEIPNRDERKIKVERQI